MPVREVRYGEGMRTHFTLVLSLLAGLIGFEVSAVESPITTGTLLREMADLERLARWPNPPYRTVQFSSYDRRSTTPEAAGWFSNADGFGREPVPGFLKVLREPDNNRPGLYLVADVSGPGAIVRGWSAGMGGVLRVYVDPTGEAVAGDKGGLIWEKPAYDFLARRSEHYLAGAGLSLEADDAFIQQDADYLPIPFARGLRVAWEGKLDQLHFYHLQVRLYPEGTRVQSFDPSRDLKEFEADLQAAVSSLTQPKPALGGEVLPIIATLSPGTNWVWTIEGKGPAAIRELKLKVQADHRDQALRGCLLRIAFDGAQRPQVEAPVGDFFGSGPGVNPYSSLPFAVAADGTMICRWVMPWERSVRVELVNWTDAPVAVEGAVRLSPWNWDGRSLYFRAKWRADHDLLAGPAAMDLPYLVAIGKGLFAGCAAMIMNPSGVPTAGGNWWGEGDEKFLVDGELSPSTFGTGSEDYFNYSWSRCDLFDHPYCGQPLGSGPDTAGYVSNHRFQVLDAIPFERSFAGLLELWSHRRTPGLSYGRIAYHYARPGAVDDHRGLTPADLKIPALPKRKLEAAGGAAGARFFLPAQLQPKASAGMVRTAPFPLATQLEVLDWQAARGERLTLTLPVEKNGRAALHLVAVHRPEGAVVRVLLDGKRLDLGNGAETVALRSAHTPRVLNVNFKPVELKAGAASLVIECLEPGPVGLDYVWVKYQ